MKLIPCFLKYLSSFYFDCMLNYYIYFFFIKTLSIKNIRIHNIQYHNTQYQHICISTLNIYNLKTNSNSFILQGICVIQILIWLYSFYYDIFICVIELFLILHHYYYFNYYLKVLSKNKTSQPIKM